ncbi:MAG: hypothetical protein ABIK44_08225 [candidate division WOR-3 bacterium]
MSWTVHRARETPGRTIAVGIFILAFLVFVYLTFELLLTLVALLVLSVALHTYFLPITYTFDDAGVTIDKRIFRHSYSWERFRRFFRTSGGIVLSPFEKHGFLDNFRGVHLLLPADPGPVIAYLERHFGAAARNSQL